MIRRLLFFTVLASILGSGAWYGYKELVFRPVFPELTSQSYLGSITLGQEKYTFYIEKLSKTQVIVLVLAPGEEAKSITLAAAPRTFLSDMRQRYFDEKPKTLYAPIETTVQKTPYIFRGTRDGEYLQGPVDNQDGSTVGSWIAAPYTAQNRIAHKEGQDMQAWLALARRKTLLAKRLNSASSSKLGQEEELRTYRELLSSNALRFRAQKAKSDLERQVYLRDTQLSSAKEQISDLVDELALHARISNEGKAILLSRRVSRRENKWYLANWADSRFGDTEISAADRIGINLEAVNQSARRAEEIRRLQLERQKERQKIELLSRPREEQFAPDRPEQQNRRRRFFGIF